MNSGKEARILATRGVMFPRDAHGQGNISGGVLLRHIDVAGALTARRACANKIIKRIVTRAMDNIEFKQPVRVNDVLTCWGYVLNIGKTSITVQVEVEVDRAGETIPVTVAQLTFVALDEKGRPTPVLDAATALPGSTGSGQGTGQGGTTSGSTGSGKSGPPVPTATDTGAIDAATPAETKVTPRKRKADTKGTGKGKRQRTARASERLIGHRATMYPLDTNGMGNIFGGHLLEMMEQGGAYVAKRVCTSSFIERCATRLMGKVEFKQPVHVNDDLTVYGMVTAIGTTSITVHVEAEVDRKGEIIPVTAADLVFVAVDEKGAKTPVLCGVSGKPTKTKTRTPKKRPAAAGKAGRRRSKKSGGCCGGKGACASGKH